MRIYAKETDYLITNAMRRMRSNKVLNTKAVGKTRSLIKRSNRDWNTSNGVYSNCWGYTAYMHGLIKELEFIDGDEMRVLLDRHFARIDSGHYFKIDSVRVGDVLVIINDGADCIEPVGSLMHTATYIGAGLYLHQLGVGGAFRIDTLNVILNVYQSDDWYHARRSKRAK